MNRIETTAVTGTTGQPFGKRSLEHLMANFPQLAQAITGLAGLPDPATVTVLAGGAVTPPVSGTTYTVAAGIALFGGAVLAIPAHTQDVAAGEVAAWHLVETPLSGDPVILTNGATASPHIQEQLRLLAVPTANPDARPLLSATVYYLVKQSPWVPVTLPAGFTTPYPTDAAPFSYRRDPHGMVHLRGSGNMDLSIGAGTGLLVNLPPGYAPAYRISFVLYSFGPDITTAIIDPDGRVYIGGISSVSITPFTLDGISFLAEN